MFDARAPTYDTTNGGWHVDFADDFISWVQPKPGQRYLDLACGTGLVTLPAKRAVGETGNVVAVDLSPGMIAQGRQKATENGIEGITWIEHDICDLGDVAEVQKVVEEEGGWDVISVCSALPLLKDPRSALKHWASLLKKGGKLIADFPTTDKTILFLVKEDVRTAIGMAWPYPPRDWITDDGSFARAFEDAGLTVEVNMKTRSYTGDHWYNADEGERIFDEKTETLFKSFARQGKLQDARRAWLEVYKRNLNEDGKLWDGHRLYVVVGSKP